MGQVPGIPLWGEPSGARCLVCRELGSPRRQPDLRGSLLLRAARVLPALLEVVFVPPVCELKVLKPVRIQPAPLRKLDLCRPFDEARFMPPRNFRAAGERFILNLPVPVSDSCWVAPKRAGAISTSDFMHGSKGAALLLLQQLMLALQQGQRTRLQLHSGVGSDLEPPCAAAASLGEGLVAGGRVGLQSCLLVVLVLAERGAARGAGDVTALQSCDWSCCALAGGNPQTAIRSEPPLAFRNASDGSSKLSQNHGFFPRFMGSLLGSVHPSSLGFHTACLWKLSLVAPGTSDPL
ncbi:hypothetical protein Anapl_17588 [Anas platyrhynchos]|uniref:Uncharacterized protein n=1 Tax=Anas platyrhynchos TaxID=8839 RepID=R0JTF4_ANAPL|nr:hypothetical protein Anapl_17588 [Anas platyrhynchos]